MNGIYDPIIAFYQFPKIVDPFFLKLRNNSTFVWKCVQFCNAIFECLIEFYDILFVDRDEVIDYFIYVALC